MAAAMFTTVDAPIKLDRIQSTHVFFSLSLSLLLFFFFSPYTTAAAAGNSNPTSVLPSWKPGFVQNSFAVQCSPPLAEKKHFFTHNWCIITCHNCHKEQRLPIDEMRTTKATWQWQFHTQFKSWLCTNSFASTTTTDAREFLKQANHGFRLQPHQLTSPTHPYILSSATYPHLSLRELLEAAKNNKGGKKNYDQQPNTKVDYRVGLFGKSVVTRTRICTEGNGTITILRTKG